jgi:hypothetical protein
MQFNEQADTSGPAIARKHRSVPVAGVCFAIGFWRTV